MPSAARNLANLLGGSATIPQEKLGSDISTIEQVATITQLSDTGNSVGDQRVVGNNLYIWNGSGWFRIALINETPTWDSGGQPEATYILSSDSPQTATTITLAATDPDGFPINYNYVTGGSMDSIATVLQDSSVFTITPKTETQAPDGGTGTITFRATDGVNILPQVSSFTLNFVTAIENSRYTTLLATVTGTSDNNNITDASSNNHTITVNGDAHAGTFSPYRHGGYSTYFDGSGDYLTATGAAIGTGDFTLEAWIYTESFSNYRTIFTNRGSSNSTGNFVLGVDSAAQVYLYSNNFLITSSSTLSANTWHHVALVRSGTGSGSTVLYIDGSSVGSADVSNNFSDTAYDIGGDTVDSYHWNGYISDLRVNIGTAIYISAFTPPTKRLTAITNTSLLTCHLPYITDGSSNDYSITVNGNVSIKPFSPYDYDEYSSTDHGGSVYFDGTGDALRIADNSNIQLGTSAFTIEGWFYCNNTTPTQGIAVKRDASGEYWRWIITGGNLNFRFQSVGGGSFTFNTVPVPANTWCHFAVTRDSNNDVRQFINGISTQNAINSTGNFDISGSTLRVGEYELNTGHFNGFVSDIKIVKNSALYTSDFTPPTAPLSSSGAIIHIKGTDASIIDKSQGTNLKLFGNTTGSTTQVKFIDTKSMYFDGTGDYINTNSNIHDDIGTAEYTAEAWIYCTSIANRSIFGSGASDAADEFGLFLLSSGHIYHDIGGSQDYVQSSSTITVNTWHHLAVTRTSSRIDIWLDGTSVGSTTNSNITGINVSGNSDFKIGYGRLASWSGYIQDVRITNGLARYTASFTPPTEPLEESSEG